MYSENNMESQKKILEQGLFNLKMDFNQVSPELIEQLAQQISELYALTYDELALLSKTPERISFQTIVQPLVDISIYKTKAENLCTFPEQTSPDEHIRQASEKAVRQLSEIKITCEQREDVFQSFRLYEQGAYRQEKDHLDPEQCRYFERIMRAYRRNGLYIHDAAVKETILDIKQKISKLSISFEHAVDEENTSFLMSAQELDGLPDSWFTKEREHQAGIYTVTLKYPDLFPVLDYATNRDTRKKIFEAYESRCEQENLPILKEILILRNNLAKILGYKTHADFAIEVGLAKNEATAKSFLNDLNTRFTPLLKDNLTDLTNFARAKEKDDTLQLELSDIRYYQRLREEEICSINMKQIAEYFPLQTVISGTLKIYEQLLGLKFIEQENTSIWHSDVQYFDVYNYDSAADSVQDKIGGFYLDLHPREGKYGHAAAFMMRARCDISHLTGNSGDKQLALSAIVCNFPKNENVNFADVVTFFHEFGHVMHFTCSDTKLAALHADFTETDFVEAPSQMLENWCYQPAALKILSSHYQTRQPLPQEIAEQLAKKEKLHAGYRYKRQLVFGLFDLNIHSMPHEELEQLDLKNYFNQLRADILMLPKSGGCFPASFGHLISEYDAGYYGYLMSETYSTDMFVNIFEKDPLSAENGARYRQCILKPGATLDGFEMLENFLGRAPTTDAFMSKNGLSSVNTYAGLGFFDQSTGESRAKRQCVEDAAVGHGL